MIGTQLQFDTLDKKPKVWNVLILSAAVLALAAAALCRWGVAALVPLDIVTVLYCAAVIAMLCSAFFRQLRYNPYSYNTILYSGFAIFTLFVLCAHVYALTGSAMSEQTADARRLLQTLLHSGKGFMYITSPFLIGFSAALFVSNVALIRHEGRRLVNILGILLAFLLVAGFAALALADRLLGTQRGFAAELLLNLFSACYLYFECMLLGTIIADGIAARYEPEKDKDYLIVLGCGIRPDGTPSPILRGRLDRALRFAAEQEAAGGASPVFVVSGGQGPDEVRSEAASMRDYLLAQGIPPQRIILEDRSADTAENMRFSKERIAAVDPEGKGKIAYSTTNYHVFRAGLKARRVKMRSQGMGAPTKWYFWPNAAVREFVGLLTEHRGKQALVLLGMVLTYTLLTVFAYRV